MMRLAALVILVSGVAWALGDLVDKGQRNWRLATVHDPVAPPLPRFGAIAPDAVWKFEIAHDRLPQESLPAPSPQVAMVLQDDGSIIEPAAGPALFDGGASPFGFPVAIKPDIPSDMQGWEAAGGTIWEASARSEPEIASPEPDITGKNVVAIPVRVPPAARVPSPHAPLSGPLVAIVIDDLGHNASLARRVIDLPHPVTLAFLPYPENTPALAQEAERAGHEVIVHLPMEPMGDANPGPHALLVDLPAQQMLDRVDWAVGRVPGADGVNNHMGSRFTSDATAMGVVLEHLKDRQLFFLDSVTTAQTVSEKVADGLALPNTARDVFIDHVPTRRSIDAQLARTEKLARQVGTALAIGHPGRATLDALEKWMPEAASRGIVFVPVNDMLAHRYCARTKLACDPQQYLAQALGEIKATE